MVKSKTLMILFIMLLFAVPLAFAPGDDEGGTEPGSPGDDLGDPGATDPGAGMSIDSGKIAAALQGLCLTIKNMLGVAMMLMVVSAAIVYSIGQVMGAETRARAAVWATSMFNGAIIAALIYLIVPWMLNQMLANQLMVGC